MPLKILVVEDSRVLSRMLEYKIRKELNFDVHTAGTLAEVKQKLEVEEHDYFMAVLDLNLPDAPKGEVVDYVSDIGIPSVVLTGTFNEELRQKLFTKNIVEYFIKKGRGDLDNVIRTISRQCDNRNTQILVVDDSIVSRKHVSRLLQRHNYEVIEVDSGEEALKVLDEQSGIKMMITDYHMPGMDGIELIGEVRNHFGKDRLSIIGLSAGEDSSVAARFLKLGANDYLNKSFFVEELFSRVSQNLEMLQLVSAIKDAANRDFLTKLHNRRWFFEVAQEHFDRSNQRGGKYCLAMLDIDFFKKINDSHGHDCGDKALKALADLLRSHFRPKDLIARLGGEEFCIYLENMGKANAIARVENFRQKVEQLKIECDGGTFGFTVSLGLAFSPKQSLSELLKSADQRLYQAKTQGRNRLAYRTENE